MIDSYTQLETGLASLIGKIKFSSSINLKLERIGRLLEILGRPHTKFASIHVAGSAGKGSTSTMIATILQQAGFKTGLHTSPHLQILNERHRINGKMAPTTTLLRLFQQMEAAIEQVAEEMPQFGKPSYFEAQFALSCLWFAEQEVDVAVIEVGLGGRLDASNVLPSAVSVITNIGLDHTEILGDTIEQIAHEKAGIIKPHQVVVTGATQPSVRAIIAEKCTAFGIPCWMIEDDFSWQNEQDQFTVSIGDRTISNLSVPLMGEFQKINATVAISACIAFAEDRISDEAIRTGLGNVSFAGRLEQVQSNPIVMLDGAHNPDKIRASVSAMPTRTRTIGVVGMKSGKDLGDVMAQIVPLVDQLIATQFSLKGLWKPYSAEEIAQVAHEINSDLPLQIEPDPIRAVEMALQAAEESDFIWITGSLYLVGDVREIWYPKKNLLENTE